jgi:hypothetical protein
LSSACPEVALRKLGPGDGVRSKGAKVREISKAVCLILVLPLAVAAQSSARIIEPGRATDWSHAGATGGIPNRTTICATLEPGARAADINLAIANCPANQVVFLNAGTYNLSAGVMFNSKSNVTLRGAGADRTLLIFKGASGCSGPASAICIQSDGYNGEAPNSTAWTGGYAPGTTVITVGNSSGMRIGGILALDQLDDSADSGAIFVCATTRCSDEGGNATGRNNRGQQQRVKVVAINGNQVTITPPIRMPNWRASQNPGVYWDAGAAVVVGAGLEDLTVNANSAKGASGIVFMHVSDSWVKGVRVINPDRAHVWFWHSMQNTVRDSYFYGGQGAGSQSYGVEGYGTGDNLIENNIFQHVTGPVTHNGSETGTVVSYNFAIDDNYTQSINWMIHSLIFHEVGISHILQEGNDGLGASHDDVHGTTHFNTLFRNHLYGDVWNNPPKTENTMTINIQSYGRFFNVVGNVLGRAGYYNTYEGTSARAIFTLGNSPETGVPDDPQVRATLMRWGNYDTVTGDVRWDPTEVPSGLFAFPNPLPASQTLPASFYRSGPPSFWSTPWGAPPWPPIGPDVTAGDIAGWGGHANKIPARLCYENTARTNNILNFSAANCYLSGPPQPDTTPPSVPANLTAVAISASQVDLNWTASTDDLGVSGYKLFRDGAHIGNAAGTFYSDSGLTPLTTYSYTVSAYDAAGNDSGESTAVAATTSGPQTATPAFSPDGGTYNTPQLVALFHPDPDAAIYYTKDGSTPTTASITYAAPISVTQTTTLKAIAVAPDWAPSAVATATYTLVAATPTFDPPAGTYTGAQLVAIADTSPGVTIYYTTNGKTPTTASTPYTGPIAVTRNMTIKAIAAAAGWTSSEVASAKYTVRK